MDDQKALTSDQQLLFDLAHNTFGFSAGAINSIRNYFLSQDEKKSSSASSANYDQKAVVGNFFRLRQSFDNNAIKDLTPSPSDQEKLKLFFDHYSFQFVSVETNEEAEEKKEYLDKYLKKVEEKYVGSAEAKKDFVQASKFAAEISYYILKYCSVDTEYKTEFQKLAASGSGAVIKSYFNQRSLYLSGSEYTRDRGDFFHLLDRRIEQVQRSVRESNVPDALDLLYAELKQERLSVETNLDKDSQEVCYSIWYGCETYPTYIAKRIKAILNPNNSLQFNETGKLKLTKVNLKKLLVNLENLKTAVNNSEFAEFMNIQIRGFYKAQKELILQKKEDLEKSASNYGKPLVVRIILFTLLALLAAFFPPFGLMGLDTSTIVANIVLALSSIAAAVSVFIWWKNINKEVDENWRQNCLHSRKLSGFFSYGGVFFGLGLLAIPTVGVFLPLITHGPIIFGIGEYISSSLLIEIPVVISAAALVLAGLLITLRASKCSVLHYSAPANAKAYGVTTTEDEQQKLLQTKFKDNRGKPPPVLASSLSDSALVSAREYSSAPSGLGYQ